ncbi:hypothetical protein [Kitasatospora sp. NPDC050463]|uniref:hypothetical protein n=1 Tax=Kitasatospora sp. NPDC050463 TaxID=3155786 RepID=UPI0033D13FDD
MSSPTFDAIADELYLLAPADFTAARNQRANELKKTDPQLAKQIRALRRPTQAAWAANLLAHHHQDLVAQLLGLGQALRDAQQHLTGTQLRELVEQRRHLVRALAGQAEQDAETAGHPLGAGAVADLERTLSAALADPDASRDLAAGRLTAALEPVLWPGAGAGAPEAHGPGPGRGTQGATRAPAPPRGPQRAPSPAGTSTSAADTKPAAARVDTGRQRLAEQKRAQAEAAAAEKAQEAASTRAQAADTALTNAEATRQRARSEAEQAGNALTAAQERDNRARDALARAEERVESARSTAHGAAAQAEQAREAARRASRRLHELEICGDDAGGG